ncbi:MAG: DUF554 domain-containing protein [Saprospiraceae bacterium]
MRLPIATFINMTTVTIGSLLGLYLNGVFPESIEKIIFQAIGLATLVMGMMMCFKMKDGYMLIFIFSMILGGVIGEFMGIDVFLQNLGDNLKDALNIGNARFTEGLVTAFLLFCIGSMTILGAIEEGLTGKRELLLVKSTLDGITSIAFAATYGIGVLFSIIPMLILQGGITLSASKLERFFTENIISMISVTGGALILGIGIRMLKLGEVNIENLLPSIVVAVVLTAGWDWWKSRD